METIDGLYDFAYKNNITIDRYNIGGIDAMSVELGGNKYFIAINECKSFTYAELLAKLAHEFGHCERGALYNEKTPIFSRGRCENMADEWAIERLIPYDELYIESRSPYNRTWELAEHFSVTEELIKKAIRYYKMPGWNL